MSLFKRFPQALCQNGLFSKRFYNLDRIKLYHGVHGKATHSPVRVRFAPSPTGQLHLGGFRTALLNYLFVLKHGGQFILRIEDTDQTRLVPNAVQNIETDLLWLGITPSEGPSQAGRFGPYIQSERLSLYQENLNKLLESGHAYECFCTEKRLDLLRREAMRLRQKPRYDNKCRDLTREEVQKKKLAGEQYCVRFKLSPEEVIFKDMVFGTVKFDLTDMNYEGDPVIMKSDGFPTYHFANVVDDHFMEVTHVLRGVEWQISTPKHLQLYKSFNWKPPEYAHLPLVLNQDGSKLSKRQGDISISHYRNETYYPLSLVNFVTKSGGGFSFHNVDKLYTMDQLAESFDINEVNQSGCHLDFVLLEKVNQLALVESVNNDISSASKTLKTVLQNKSMPFDQCSEKYIEKILRWSPERVTKIKDLTSPNFNYLWSHPSPSVLSQVNTGPDILQGFIEICNNELYNESNQLRDSQDVSALLKAFSLAHNLKHKTFLKDLRIVLCGILTGPPILEIFHLFGKEMVLNRLEQSLQHVSNAHSIKNHG